MSKPKICIAINDKSVENWLKKKLAGDFDFTKDVLHTNMCLDVIKSEHPDILILFESLEAGKRDINEDSMSVALLAHKIRTNFRGCRIIFVAGLHKMGDNLLKTLVMMNVHDIVMSDEQNKIKASEIVDMVYNPRDYDYSSRFLGDLKEDLETLKLSQKATFVDRYYIDSNGKKLPNHTVGVIEKSNNTLSQNPQNPYNRHNATENMINEVIRQQMGNYGYTNEAYNNTLNNYQNNSQNNNQNGNSGIPALQNLTYQNTENNEAFYNESPSGVEDTTILTNEDNINPVFTHIIFRLDNNNNVVTAPNAKDSIIPNTPINAPSETINYTDSGYRQDMVLYSDNNFGNLPYQTYERNYKNTGYNYPQKKANLIVVTGALDGVGTTTTALNIAYTYAKEGKETLVIDACIGNLSVYSKCGLTDNGYDFGNMCEDFKKQVPIWQMCLNKDNMQKNSDRYTMFPDTLKFMQINELSDDNTFYMNEQETIKGLMSVFDVIVVDTTIKSMSNLANSFISLANKIVVVTTQDLDILNKTKKALDKYEMSTPIYRKLIACVNRCDTRISPSAKDIKDYLTPLRCVYVLSDNEGFLRGTSDGIIYSSFGKKKIRNCYKDLVYQTGEVR